MNKEIEEYSKKEIRNKPKYTSDINIVASIPNYNMINDVIYLVSHGQDRDYINKEILEMNTYGIPTLKARQRFLTAIYTNFIDFKTEDHEKIFYSLFSQKSLLNLKKIALFLQFAINNQLFYDLTDKVTMKLYKEGRLTISKDEYISYLYYLREQSEDLQRWTSATVDIIASKYLTLLKKLGFLKGSLKKEFCRVDIDNQSLVYIVYLLKSLNYKNSDIMKNPFIDILPLTKEDFFIRVKRLALSDYFKIYTLGDNLKIELNYGYEDIVNVIIQNN